MIKSLFARRNAQAHPAPPGFVWVDPATGEHFEPTLPALKIQPLTDAERDELERLRAAMTWIECAARIGEIEIAQTPLWPGFEFRSRQSGRIDGHKAPRRSLLAAIEHARAPCARN